MPKSNAQQSSKATTEGKRPTQMLYEAGKQKVNQADDYSQDTGKVRIDICNM